MRIRLVIFVGVGVMLISPLVAFAQGPSKIKAGGGYSYLKDPDQTANVGAVADAMYRFFKSTGDVVAGAVGEFGINHFVRKPFVDFWQMQYMGGVRVTTAKAARVMPFGQVLIGVQRCCSDFNALTFQPGGGVDIRFTHLFGRTLDLRVQADLPIQRYNGANYLEYRGTVGVAVPIRD